MLTSGEIWWQVYRHFVLFFSTFCMPIFFFQIIKRRYFTHASRPPKLEENGHVICRQHLRVYFVVPVIQWDYLSDLLRVPKPTNPYSEPLGDETQKTSGTCCARRRAATLRWARFTCARVTCAPFTCAPVLLCTWHRVLSALLPCLATWILCHRRRPKPVPSSLWTQKANSLIGNGCFSSPWDGENHFPFLQAVESHCPPGNEERFPGLYFSTCYKINYSFVSFQGWGRVNRGGEMH